MWAYYPWKNMKSSIVICSILCKAITAEVDPCSSLNLDTCHHTRTHSIRYMNRQLTLKTLQNMHSVCNEHKEQRSQSEKYYIAVCEMHILFRGRSRWLCCSYFPRGGWLRSTIDCINTPIRRSPCKQGFSPFCEARHEWSQSSWHSGPLFPSGQRGITAYCPPTAYS